MISEQIGEIEGRMKSLEMNTKRIQKDIECRATEAAIAEAIVLMAAGIRCDAVFVKSLCIKPTASL